MAKTRKTTKKRNVKVESEGIAYIQASFNNIIISLTNKQGQVVSWASAGKAGFNASIRQTRCELESFQRVLKLIQAVSLCDV